MPLPPQGEMALAGRATAFKGGAARQEGGPGSRLGGTYRRGTGKPLRALGRGCHEQRPRTGPQTSAAHSSEPIPSQPTQKAQGGQSQQAVQGEHRGTEGSAKPGGSSRLGDRLGLLPPVAALPSPAGGEDWGPAASETQCSRSNVRTLGPQGMTTLLSPFYRWGP